MEQLLGRVFTYWTVLSEGEQYVCETSSARRFICRCKCGTVKLVFRSDLLAGRSMSCGCYMQAHNAKKEALIRFKFRELQRARYSGEE